MVVPLLSLVPAPRGILHDKLQRFVRRGELTNIQLNILVGAHVCAIEIDSDHLALANTSYQNGLYFPSILIGGGKFEHGTHSVGTPVSWHQSNGHHRHRPRYGLRLRHHGQLGVPGDPDLVSEAAAGCDLPRSLGCRGPDQAYVVDVDGSRLRQVTKDQDAVGPEPRQRRGGSRLPAGGRGAPFRGVEAEGYVLVLTGRERNRICLVPSPAVADLDHQRGTVGMRRILRDVEVR